MSSKMYRQAQQVGRSANNCEGMRRAETRRSGRVLLLMEVPSDAHKPLVTFQNISLDPSRHVIVRDGQESMVSELYWRTLMLLIDRRPNVVLRDQLRQIWGESITDRAIDKRIEKLRKYLGDTTESRRFIRTEYGVGYSFIGMQADTAQGDTVRNDQTAPFTEASLGVTDNCNMNGKEKNVATTNSRPQKTKWRAKWADHVTGPSGIILDDDETQFVPWEKLRGEIEEELLPNVRMVPVGSTVELGDYFGRKEWIIRIIDQNGLEVGNVWFGGDPLKDYAYDGLVRLGIPTEDKTVRPTVWQVFQRHSNGLYFRVSNPYDSAQRHIET